MASVEVEGGVTVALKCETLRGFHALDEPLKTFQQTLILCKKRNAFVQSVSEAVESGRGQTLQHAQTHRGVATIAAYRP